MNLVNFKEMQDKKVESIESVIRRYLPSETGYQKMIMEAMNYSILGGGKRLRPLLMQETYHLFGGVDTKCIEPFMAAIEMIHTYSLVHDDLPAMDNDELRRGRKTTHVVYGEAMGILAGDALLNYAFETACKAFFICPEDKMKQIARSIQILGNKAGIFGMVGGQVIDIQGATDTQCESMKNITINSGDYDKIIDRLDCMYKLKTSALIEAAMMIGAVLAGADDHEVATVEQIASNVGLAFQIQDDILDETSTTEVLGKPIHSDERNDKVTYVTLMGLEDAKKEVEKLSAMGLSLLSELGRTNEFLKELILKLITREK